MLKRLITRAREELVNGNSFAYNAKVYNNIYRVIVF